MKTFFPFAIYIIRCRDAMLSPIFSVVFFHSAFTYPLHESINGVTLDDCAADVGHAQPQPYIFKMYAYSSILHFLPLFKNGFYTQSNCYLHSGGGRCHSVFTTFMQLLN